MRKLIAASVATALLPIAACADTPPTPPTPPVANVEASIEACGDDCTKHVVRTVTVEIDDDGNETRSENVRVIRHSGDLTEEQKAEIEAMMSEGGHDGHMMMFMDDEDGVHEFGNGDHHVMMFKNDGEHELADGDGSVVIMMKTIGEDGEYISVNSLGNTDIENTVAEDGTRTIRIKSGDDGEVTVITITKESSE